MSSTAKNFLFSETFRNEKLGYSLKLLILRSLYLLPLYLGICVTLSYGQVIVPIREGFPYCEPFTGADVRANTVLGGRRFVSGNSVPIMPTLTGESLMLTTNGGNENGYVFVDIPFPSFYGLKVSFEYSSYGKTSDMGADGFSFFMFDGSIDESSFEIGGAGGALGYTARQGELGLKGGYIGIGFDEYGNFGNFYENKRYGFLGTSGLPTTNYGTPGQPAVNPENFFSHSVVVRGPVAAGDNVRNNASLHASYEFISGKLLNNNIGDFPGVIDEFYLDGSFDRLKVDIDSPIRIFDCNEEGYRKVFIDLQPQSSGGYRILVWILAHVNGRLQVFPVIDSEYNFTPPPFLKVGFAASTGGKNNFHEIRNVTVEVSDETQLDPPVVNPQIREVCEGEQLDFEFPVDLVNQGSFVTCIQLFQTEQDALNSRPTITPQGQIPTVDDCGLSGNCQIELCQEGRTELPTEFGTFETFLIETNGIFSQGIKFQSNQSTSGEITIYYTATDNFGQVSLPKPITITVHPLPIAEITTIDPRVWEEIEVNEIYVKLEAMPKVDGFQFQWFKNGIAIPGAINDFYLALGSGAIGIYTVEIISDNGCLGNFSEEIKIRLINNLRPDPTGGVLRETCADEGIITIRFDPLNVFGDEIWRIVNSAGVKVYPIGGGWNSIGVGTASVSQSNLLAGEYIFQIGDSFRFGQPGSDGQPLFRHVIPFTILPIENPLRITSVDVDPELCFGEGGRVEVTASGGEGPASYTFTLTNTANGQVRTPTSITGGTAVFETVIQGNYEAVVTSAIRCTLQQPLNMTGPASPLALAFIELDEISCGINDSGFITWEASGGTPGYTFVGLTRNGSSVSSPILNQTPNSTFKFTKLTVGQYVLTVADANGCEVSSSSPENLTELPAPIFDTEDVTVCEGTDAVLTPKVVSNTIGAIPVYKWYYKDGAGNYIQITNGLSLSGVTFAINGSNQLSVSNLASQASAYTYYLNVTGNKVCDQGYIPSEILVNPKPTLAAPTITQVTCNGAANGIIQAQLTSGNLGDFEYSLIGNNGVSRPFANNSGLFNLLPPGTYKLTVKSAKGCEASAENLIVTEPSPLLLNQVSKTDATCALNNGTIRLTASGATPDGTGKYIIKVNGADISTFGSSLVQNGPADFTLSNLAPGIYKIEAEDINGCKKELSITILNTAVPVFDAEDVAVCEGTDAVLTPKVVSNTIGAIPVYAWSYENTSNPSQFVQINNGDVVNGATHTLSNGVLTIKGLKYAVANYKYYLTVSGTTICPAAPIEAEVKVLKIPTAVFEIGAVSCFGGTNGQITLKSVDPAGPNTFTLVETGASNSTGNFSNLKAGTYTIRIKETGSPCQSESQVVITEPAKLELVNPLKSDPTCNEINGSVSFDVKGGVKAYQILINGKAIADYSFGQTGDRYEIKNLAPGTYSIQITDANACFVDQPNLFILKNDDGLTVTINPLEEEKCVGSPAILNPVFGSALPVIPNFKWYKDAGLLQPITSNANPDSNNITYLINPSGVLTITGLQVGGYKYFLEISGQGICTLVEEANVKIIPQILADIVVDDITCFGQKDGSISVTPSGGNGNFEIRLNGGAYSGNKEYPNLGAGNYTVDIRNDIGCVTSYQVVVKGPSGPISINKPSIIRASCDLDNGSIEDLVISGGWNSYTVEWRFGSATGTMIPGGLTGAKNLAPGTYFLLVSDGGSCIATFTFVIEESSDPVYAVVPPINSCTGPPVLIRPIHIAPNPSLPPAAATEVKWFTGPGQTGLIQNGPDPSAPAVSYTIDDSDWLNPELVITGLPGGTYDFYFYVVCTGQEIKIDVTVYNTPAITLETKAIVCFGDTNGKVKVLSGSIPTYTYSVNGGAPINQTAFEALNLAAGAYSLAVATPAGCAQNLNFTIAGPSAPLASSPLTKIDPGCGAPNGKLNLTITGGWLPYTLDIVKDGVSLGLQTINQSNITLNGYRPGVYQIRITDKEGCFVITNTVTLVDGPTQILADSDEICVGSVASLVPKLDPVATGASFQWFLDAAKTQLIVSSPSPASDGRIYQINAATGELTIENLPASVTEYNYYVIASGSGICTGFTGNGKVRVYSNPTATAVIANEICFDGGGTITVNASGGSGTYSYSLNGGAFITPNVFQVARGTYEVVIQTPQGCGFTLSNIEVTGPSAALAVSDIQMDSPSCDLDNGEIRFNVLGGYPPYTISYNKNSVNTGTINLDLPGIATISNLGEGSYLFQVTDAKGCVVSIPNALSLLEVPSVITALDEVICEGKTANLTATLPQNIPNPSYVWSFDREGKNTITSSSLNNVTYTVNTDGTMSVNGLLASGSPYTFFIMATGPGICGLSPKPVTVTVNSIPVLRVSNPSVVCDPVGSVDLTNFIEGFNPAVYDYNVLNPSGSVMRLEDIATVQASGDYRVSSSLKGKGCWNQAQRIRVIISDTLLEALFEYQVDLGGGLIINNGDIQIEEAVQFGDLSKGKIILWEWNFGDGSTSSDQSPSHTFLEKGAYTVTLLTIDEFGCESIYEIVVNVFDDYKVMVPNAFTPDGLKNKYFKPQYRGISSMEFYIFNTWGELIYESKSLEDTGWDGTLNGTPTPNGNYVYKGRFVSRSGEIFEKSGVFLLIR